MKLACPVCESDVPLEDVDMSSESAFCCRCQRAFDCKDWIQSALVTPENLRHPPEGASYERSARGFKVVVSTRSYRWLFFLPAACFWSALMLFFSWACFHAQPGMRWILFLFLTPFWLFGAALWCGVLMPIFGRVAIQVDGETGRIFKGVGSLGWSRRFDWREVEKIRLSTYYLVNWNAEQITLEGDQVIQAARGVRHDRLCYMLIALRHNHRKEPIHTEPPRGNVSRS